MKEMIVKHTVPRKKTKENQVITEIVMTYTCHPMDFVGSIWTVIVYVGYW